MSKLGAMLEKFNLIENTGKEAADFSEVSTDSIQEDIETKDIEDEKADEELQDYESSNTENEIPDKTDIKKKGKLTVQEIYSLYDLENSAINTIFMLGNFINALPESLPHEIRKKSVISIINSSNADLNKLLVDGQNRLKALQQFLNEYTESTTYSIEEYKNKIAELKKSISYYEEQIRVNENLQKEQNSIIKYEAEKINNINNFFNDAD